jgi:hypothetical protein
VSSSGETATDVYLNTTLGRGDSSCTQATRAPTRTFPVYDRRRGLDRPRVPDRDEMNAIVLVLRTRMQWNALNATGVCSSSSAHRRFQQCEQAGVFHEIWRQALLEYDKVVGIRFAVARRAALESRRTAPG